MPLSSTPSIVNQNRAAHLPVAKRKAVNCRHCGHCNTMPSDTSLTVCFACGLAPLSEWICIVAADLLFEVAIRGSLIDVCVPLSATRTKKMLDVFNWHCNYSSMCDEQ
eukprot:3954-Heterococcus_DN1.PRE.1